MTTAAFDSGALPDLPLQVKARTLLIMMATVPAGILVALIDHYFFNAFLRDYAMQPVKVTWWVAVLSTPHIVASFFTFADREYVVHYKKQLQIGIGISILLGLGLPVLLGYLLKPDHVTDIDFVGLTSFGSDATLIAAAFYTTYHNLQQQYGISLMLMRERPTFIYHLWKWITIIPASLIFMGMLLYHEGIVLDSWPKFVMIASVNMAFAVFIAARIVTDYMKKPGYSKIGIAYFCANAAMLFVSFGLVLKGYVLVAMLMPRVIHDLTAYWIYMVHDENRNAAVMRNPIYALPAKIGIRPAILCVPLSFVLGYLLLVMSNKIYAFSFFVIALNFMHYYIEGHIWKRGTPAPPTRTVHMKDERP